MIKWLSQILRQPFLFVPIGSDEAIKLRRSYPSLTLIAL